MAKKTGKKNPPVEEEFSEGASGIRIGKILKSAVDKGNKIYSNAEERVQKTLGAVPFTKDSLKDLISEFMDNYKLNIQATLEFEKKNKKGASKKS